ncbi:hypothetical protein HWV62_41258 [Athelia sp. TMB]|nr:hypothetical protein HWV62_41258 [Athelia sp. TMB]
MSSDDLKIDHDIETLTSSGSSLINAILDCHSLQDIKALIDAGAPLWYQDDLEGISPLHAAAYLDDDGELAKYLLANGAIWNAVDHLQNTAGDIALSLNNEACYAIIRDAGIRAELLLTLLASRATSEQPDSLVLKNTEDDATAFASTAVFLASKLTFVTDPHGQEICLLKSGDEEVGVMMGWEQGIMEETVTKLCTDHENLGNGLKVLNVGFGLGMIDSLFQSLVTPPSLHVIIEPHPDVIQHMKDRGWHTKPGVKILEGKWQDFIDSDDILSIGGFDVVYTDTFSEDYKALHAFFEHLPDLLAGSESRFSFFNGLGATNALFYDVYTRLSDFHLSDVGVNVEWSDVDVTQGEDERWGKTREYFAMPIYRLPIGKMKAM